MRRSALVAPSALAAASVVHAAWVFGVSWPAADRRELADSVAGTWRARLWGGQRSPGCGSRAYCRGGRRPPGRRALSRRCSRWPARARRHGFRRADRPAGALDAVTALRGAGPARVRTDMRRRRKPRRAASARLIAGVGFPTISLRGITPRAVPVGVRVTEWSHPCARRTLISGLAACGRWTVDGGTERADVDPVGRRRTATGPPGARLHGRRRRRRRRRGERRS